jgi:DNA-binding protein YbaB
MFDMMKKLQEAQRQMKEIKERLERVSVKGTAEPGISITANGNRKILSVELPENFQSMDKNELETALRTAMDQAIANADQIYEAEMNSAASGMMPGLGSLLSKG